MKCEMWMMAEAVTGSMWAEAVAAKIDIRFYGITTEFRSDSIEWNSRESYYDFCGYSPLNVSRTMHFMCMLNVKSKKNLNLVKLLIE